MKHGALRCHTPLSPPPMLPTTTLALPPTEHELAYGLECDSDSDTSDVDDDLSTGWGDDDDFAASHLNRDDTVAQLLSPISPEWHSNVTISLLSLPGADSEEDTFTLVDDEYPPFPSSPYGSHPSASSSNSSLLLLDDPNELPLSPTPESLPLDLFWLASIPESELHPDLHRLSALLFRSRSAEREARRMEGLMLEAGDPHRRAEARRERKVEKERGREVEALLRLKIEEMGLGSSSSGGGGDGGGGSGGPDDEEEISEGDVLEQKKPGLGAMRDLVARMVFRCRDSWRPLAQRQKPFMKSGSCRVRSPLASRVYREGDGDMDADDEDEDEWFERLSGFDSNSGSGSHWSSTTPLEMHDTDPTDFELKSHPGQS